ncbi:MAG TPA: DUF1634 domain-containing protein [Candidatus Binataceae bacterium]
MATGAETQQVAAKVAEERILRFWTPILLRTILIVAIVVLVAGLILAAALTPDYFVDRYRQVQLGNLIGREKFIGIVPRMLAGNPHAILTFGLFLLTLVPLARVAFCFLLFIREKDYAYVVFTAYVLAGLIIGVLLGGAG